MVYRNGVSIALGNTTSKDIGKTRTEDENKNEMDIPVILKNIVKDGKSIGMKMLTK